MSEIIDLSKEQDLPGCVEAPVFLMEMMRAVPNDAKKPLKTMLEILGELAFFVSKTNNPALRILALRLGLFPMSQEELKKAIQNEIGREKELRAKREAMEAAKVKAPEEPTDDGTGKCAEK